MVGDVGVLLGCYSKQPKPIEFSIKKINKCFRIGARSLWVDITVQPIKNDVLLVCWFYSVVIFFVEDGGQIKQAYTSDRLWALLKPIIV